MRKEGSLSQQRNCGQQDTRYDSYKISVKEYFTYSMAGVFYCAVIAFTFYRSIAVFILLIPAGMVYPLYMRRSLRDRRIQKLIIEFKDGITVLSSFLSAGYSVENAFKKSVREISLLYGKDGLITKEFSYMSHRISMNQPVENVLADFADRSGVDEVKSFSEVFAAAKRGGGNLVSIISHTTGVINDKIQIREEIITLTSARKFEQKIMNIIPFLIVFYIEITSPGFFNPIYESIPGRIIMTICMCIYIVAYIIAEKILSIEI